MNESSKTTLRVNTTKTTAEELVRNNEKFKISSLYDNSYERVFSDIDILVKEEEYTAIKEIMTSRGYNCYKQKDNVQF